MGQENDGIGLALSGGGFRATLFHLGAVQRLNELSILENIERISAVSGGTFLSGLMAAKWKELTFRGGVAENFQEKITQPIWQFCSLNVDVKATLYGMVSGTRYIEKCYRKYLVGDKTLQDTPDRPEFIFNTAHLETGRNWLFSKKVMRTYKLGIIEEPKTELYKVLAASSAIPPFFPPLVLMLDPDTFQRSEYAELFHRTELKKKVTLADGGIYDNLGMHSIRDMETLLISDSSAPLESSQVKPPFGWFLNRTLRPKDIATEQARALRRHDIVTKLSEGSKKGCLWTARTNLANYPATKPFRVDNRWPEELSSLRTRLSRFSDEEKSRLINWGYIQCDLAVRSYYRKDAEISKTLPFPDLPLE